MIPELTRNGGENEKFDLWSDGSKVLILNLATWVKVLRNNYAVFDTEGVDTFVLLNKNNGKCGKDMAEGVVYGVVTLLEELLPRFSIILNAVLIFGVDLVQ